MRLLSWPRASCDLTVSVQTCHGIAEKDPRATDVEVLDDRLCMHHRVSKPRSVDRGELPEEFLVRPNLVAGRGQARRGPDGERAAVRRSQQRLRQTLRLRLDEVAVEARHHHEERETRSVVQTSGVA